VIGWAVFVGVGATLLMDLWALFLLRAFAIRSLDYALVGRWLGHMPKGSFIHEKIATAAAVPGERPIGWIAHYVTGIAFAGGLLLLAGPNWTIRPTPWPAIFVGLASIILPFFVMQPAFGLGVAASKLPAPNVARFRSLLTHLVFGIGLYVSAMAYSRAFA
jgi:hypothetical protein